MLSFVKDIFWFMEGKSIFFTGHNKKINNNEKSTYNPVLNTYGNLTLDKDFEKQLVFVMIIACFVQKNGFVLD